MLTWLKRVFCQHRELEKQASQLWPALDTFWCKRCSKLSHVVERDTGFRYSSFEQYTEERTF